MNEQQVTSSSVSKKETTHKVAEEDKFGLGGATLYGINVVLGTGILLLPRLIYQNLGPASIVGMILTTVLFLLIGFCFAEVAGYFTKNGGAYEYAKEAYNEPVAFNIGLLSWFTVIAVWSASASGFAELLATTFPMFAGYEALLGIIIIVAMSIMNLTGIKTAKFFTIVVTIAKMLPMLAVALIGLFFIKGGFEAGNFTPFLQLAEGQTFSGGLAATTLTVFYAFVGFESLPIIAGEVKNPKKNVPLALIGSLSFVSVLYIFLIVVAIAILGSNILTSSAPIQEAFAGMVGSWGYWFVAVAAIISLVGLNVGDSTHTPRQGQAIADDGLLPSYIAKTNKVGAPSGAIIISGLISIILIATGSFETLVELSVVFYFFQYIPTAYAVIALRKRDDLESEGFKVPGGSIIPILAIVICLWMLIADDPFNLVIGAIGVVIATTIYYIYNKGFKKGNSVS